MIRLFDENDKYTDKADQYDTEIGNALQPIVDKAKAEGVSLRDLTYIINSTTNELVLSKLIGWN
jgi:hypothetical protein